MYDLSISTEIEYQPDECFGISSKTISSIAFSNLDLQ